MAQPEPVEVAPVEMVEPIAVGIKGEGLTGPELAEKLGLPANTIKSWGTRHGETKQSHKAIGDVPPWRYDKTAQRWYPVNQEEN